MPRGVSGRTCLVAVDASDASVHALVWAFRHATMSDMCVEVLTDTGAAVVRASARCELVVLGTDADDRSHSLTDRILVEAACEVVVVGSSGEAVATNRPTARGV